MGYSRNFGFRSFENIVRDGRFRIPKDLTTGGFGGDPVIIGTAVAVDPDPTRRGLLRRPAAAEAPTPLCGIVLFEHIQFQGVDTSLVTTSDEPYNQVPPGRYAQMIHGLGAKVWFKNTADKPMYDGRVQGGGTLYDLADTAADLDALAATVGSYLTPNADGIWVEGDADTGWLIIEQVTPATGLIECRLTF